MTISKEVLDELLNGVKNADNLRVAISCCLHQKSPQISCRKNSTFEHH
jgi:hypothetical protein